MDQTTPFSINNEKNICLNILRRQLHNHCLYRFDLKLLRSLVLAKHSTYKKVWERSDSQAMCYESGKLYFTNYRKCFNICGIGKKPHMSYKLDACSPSEKIENGLVCQAHVQTIVKQHKGCRPSFLALTANNWLERLDADTGQLLQRVYLSPRFKFRSLDWETDGSAFVLSSTHEKMAVLAREAGIVPTLGKAMAVFKVFPLEFVCMFQVSKQVFGSSVTDAMVSQGCLLVLYHNAMIKFFSMEHLLEQPLEVVGRSSETQLQVAENGRICRCGLGCRCEEIGGVLGEKPFGLPLNIKLTEPPPVLLEVQCKSHQLVIGGIPWHYIITPPGQYDTFSVYSVAQQCLAKNGVLDSESLSIEPARCSFYADDNRILYIAGNEIRVLRLGTLRGKQSGVGDVRYTLTEEYKINPGNTTQQKDMGRTRVTSSGRIIKRSIYCGEDVLDGSSTSLQTVDYEDELDFLVFTSIRHEEDIAKATVHLHDSTTGKWLKDIPLDEPWREFCNHTVIIDRHILVHISKSPRRFHCYVYILDTLGGNTDTPKHRKTSTRTSHRVTRSTNY